MTVEAEPAIRLQRVVVLGANGAMGAGSAAMFASGGCEVVLVARDRAKAEGVITSIQGITKSERVADRVSCATYDDGYASLLAGADLIFETVAEEMDLKRQIFEQVDAHRSPDSLVATVSSGLSIRDMCEGRSESFRSHFAGIHLYNPPHVMVGTELIPHPDMQPGLARGLSDLLQTRFGRAMVTCSDTAAFAGNRIGFKVLNEVAQLAETHGVELMDTLVGPYTGRAMAPLATVDLVGWDVHQAIVDNVHENIADEAHDSFRMPDYMRALAGKGHLGDKTPESGGFFRRVTAEGGKTSLEALDPASGAYQEARTVNVPFVEEVRQLQRSGLYRDGVRHFMDADGPEAAVARKVILGYVSYALHRFGPDQVVADYADIDRIMTAGFNWAPPSGLVDLIGAARARDLFEKHDLPVPPLVEAAARNEVPTPLFNLPFVTPGRYFSG